MYLIEWIQVQTYTLLNMIYDIRKLYDIWKFSKTRPKVLGEYYFKEFSSITSSVCPNKILSPYDTTAN